MMFQPLKPISTCVFFDLIFSNTYLFAAAPTPAATVAAPPVVWPGSWSWAGFGSSPG